MKQKISIIKIGGQVIEDLALLDVFLGQISRLTTPVLLVHGGGKSATIMATRLGIPTLMTDGRRKTDAAMLEIVTMVYGGLANKNIVARLQAKGKNAIGLSGADANTIRAVRRPSEPIDFGFVGDITPASFNIDFIKLLINQNMLPVLAPLTYDGQGGLLNTNADTIAANLAIALIPYYQVQLLYCFEKPGVLLDDKQDLSLIKNLKKTAYKALCASGAIHQGMIPKLENAFKALENGVGEVAIAKYDRLEAVLGDKNYHEFTRLEV